MMTARSTRPSRRDGRVYRKGRIQQHLPSECGLPIVIAYLYSASTSLVEDNLRKKQETPERSTLLRQSAALFERLPENTYDIAVAVKSLADAECGLEEKLAAYMELH
jgi:hypothetical protein